VRSIVRKSKNILEKINEMLFQRRRFNWACISQPLSGDPGELFGIHDPTIEEYRMTVRADGGTRTAYDWWYSAIVQDSKKRFFFVILAFHPKWSFYRIAGCDLKNSSNDSSSLVAAPVIGGDFRSEIKYEEHEDAIEMWVAKTREPPLSKEESMRCTIEAGRSQLTLEAGSTKMEMSFARLGPVFWVNRGREAVCSPTGDRMYGFYGASQVQGSMMQDGVKTGVSGVGVNEHLISFAPLEHFWRRIDGVFVCTDQLYCTFVYLQNQTGSKLYEYKDGAIVLRASNEYLIPIDFRIEYLKLDSRRRVPTKIRVLAQTAKGELDIISEAIAETERQLALRIVEGHFSFNSGERLELTNGYGQHALH
jgi:hypothetical protein